jgi:hypothetical protein
MCWCNRSLLSIILMDVKMPGKEELRLWNKWMQGIFKHFTRKTLA